ncbi:MAG TPA: hypothetical protein VEC11_12990 [Allosphingosinicella sp.]|nr:hypothetical protein [Allosphingosinicella sp.]
MRMWDAVRAAAAGVEDDGSYDRPAGPGDSAARRAAAFRTGAGDLALPDDRGERPFGVIIDMASSRGTTSLVAFATGEASLLVSTGDGVIGRPNHAHVVVQAKRLVKEAAGLLAHLAPATADPAPPPFPPPGSLRFHVLTPRGTFTGEAPLDNLRSGGSPLSPLLEVADDLMSEFLQYTLPDSLDAGPPTAGQWLKVLLMVAVIAGLTVAAWFIPWPWLRWPALIVGGFFTIAALIVPYAMWRAPRDGAGGRDGGEG